MVPIVTERKYNITPMSSVRCAECVYRNYLLAQAHVDAPALAHSIAHLNAQSTFTPLQALQDTDVDGYIKQVHEQNIVATIEEARRGTQAAFYAALDKRAGEEWEAKKRRVFEQLGNRLGADPKSVSAVGSGGAGKKSQHGKGALQVSGLIDVGTNCSRLQTG
jgi:nuclear pore complex protein Nup93